MSMRSSKLASAIKFVSFLSVAAAAVSLPQPAEALPLTFVGTLSNLGEPSPAELSLGTGSVTVILDEDAFTLNVHADFANLTGLTNAAHIHCCTATPGVGNAGVATPVPSFPGFPLGVQSGSYDQLFDLTQASSWNPAFISANGDTTASAFAAFSSGINAGEAYFNIHTSFVPGGEIRAFLTPPGVAPEPQSGALILIGLGAVASLVSRRHR